MKLESFVWWVSLATIVGVSVYVFYAFFAGIISGFAAFAVLVVTYAAFGFLLAVATYLAEERKGGWSPREEYKRWRVSRVPSGARRMGVIPGFAPPPPRYGSYRKLAIALLVIGFLLILESPALGLIVMSVAALSYVIMRAIELYEVPEED